MKSASLCFVGNFYKTYLFHEVSVKLRAKGIKIFWIVSKLDHYNFLKQYYECQDILYINRTFIGIDNEQVDDFKLNELIYGDRVLRHEMVNGLKFLTNIQQPLYDFLFKNKIRFVIGEITWAHELVIQRMTKARVELNCTYIQCSDIRIPNSRFAFFVDETEFKLLEFNSYTNLLNSIEIEKPKYLGLIDDMIRNSISIKGRLGRVKRFVTGKNIEKNDPNVIVNRFARFKIATREEINKTLYGFVRTLDYKRIIEYKYIFFGFHKQPENSIDVHGRYYEDQLTVVKNLWRLLPSGWKLVLKEHTNAIGDRSYSFYRQLLKYPNIILANEKINSKLLIEHSQLVATVSGTMAYEAALTKKASITFARVFFNRINYCKNISLDDLIKYNSLADLSLELLSKEDNRLEFSNYLISNSFEGYISDYFTDPTVMDENNVSKISDGFIRLVQVHA